MTLATQPTSEILPPIIGVPVITAPLIGEVIVTVGATISIVGITETVRVTTLDILFAVSVFQ